MKRHLTIKHLQMPVALIVANHLEIFMIKEVKAAVISFAKYYLSKATPEDPMVEVYRTLLDGAMELK